MPHSLLSNCTGKYLQNHVKKVVVSAHLGNTCAKIGAIQRRLAWLLSKDDTEICDTFHIFSSQAWDTKAKINK